MEEAITVLVQALLAPANPELQTRAVEASGWLLDQHLLGLAWLHVYQGLLRSDSARTDLCRAAISRALREIKHTELEKVEGLSERMAELALPVFIDFVRRDDRFDPETIHDLAVMLRQVYQTSAYDSVLELGFELMASGGSVVAIQKGIRVVLECIAGTSKLESSVGVYHRLVNAVTTIAQNLPGTAVKLQILEAITSGDNRNPHFVGLLVPHMTTCPRFVDMSLSILNNFVGYANGRRNTPVPPDAVRLCLEFVANTISMLWDRTGSQAEIYLQPFLQAAYLAMRFPDFRREAVKGLSDFMRICRINLTRDRSLFPAILKCAMFSEKDLEDEARVWFNLYCPYEDTVFSPRLTVLQLICVYTPTEAPIILEYVTQGLLSPAVHSNDRLLEAYLIILAILCESNPNENVWGALIERSKEALRVLSSHGNPRVILTLHYLLAAVLTLVNESNGGDLIALAKSVCTQRFMSVTPSQCDVLNFTMACHLGVALVRHGQAPLDQLGIIISMMDQCSTSDASVLVNAAVHSLRMELPTARRLLIQTVLLLHDEFSRIGQMEDREVEENESGNTLSNQLDICAELLRMDGILVNGDVAQMCDFVNSMISLSFSPILDASLLFVANLLPRMLAISHDGFRQINEIILHAWRNSEMDRDTGYDYAKLYMRFFSNAGYDAIPLPELIHYMDVLTEPYCGSEDSEATIDVIMVHSLLCRIVQCEAFPMADLGHICELIVRVENVAGHADPRSWDAADLMMRAEFRLSLLWRGVNCLPSGQDDILPALLDRANDLMVLNYHRKLFIRAFSKFIETNQDPGQIRALMTQMAQGPSSLGLLERIFEYEDLGCLDQLPSPIDCDIPGFVTKTIYDF